MRDITQKQKYINCLTHDAKYFEECVNSKDLFNWFHGDRFSRGQMRLKLKEVKDELAKVEADKTYKPWKESSFRL